MFSQAIGQNCGMPNVMDFPDFQLNYNRANPNTSYVAINLIVVKDLADNLPTGSLLIEDEIKFANSKFSAAGIQFYLCKVTETVPTSYANTGVTDADFANLYNLQNAQGSQYRRMNMINIYHVNQILPNGNNGYTRFPHQPTSNMILLKGTFDDGPTTLCHELGHYFGLLHTHNGSAPGTIFMPLVREPKRTLVSFNGSDIPVGDGIADTPSDPGNCQYNSVSCLVDCIITPTDIENQPYDEVTQHNNIMSYRCQGTFTQQQIIAMGIIIDGARANVVSPQISPVCDAVFGRVQKVCGEQSAYLQIPLDHAKINITKSNNTSCAKRTNIYGIYRNDNCVSFGQSYSVNNAPSKFIAGQALYVQDNGVTTADLIAMNRHILLLKTLANPYYWLAADVNFDGKISTADVAKTRKVILKIDAGFDQSDSWRFVPEWYNLQPDFANEFNDISSGVAAGPFKAEWTDPQGTKRGYLRPGTSNSKSYMDQFDVLANHPDIANESLWTMTAVKTGDVNCSSKVDYQASEDENNLPISTPSHLCIEAGDTATFDLIATSAGNMLAYQTQLDFQLPTNPLATPYENHTFDIFNINGGQLSNSPAEFFNLIAYNDRKELKVSWLSDNMTTSQLQDGTSILQFSIKCSQRICDLSTLVNNVNDEISTQLYDSTGNLILNPQLQLVKSNVQARSAVLANFGRTISVFPNPFRDLLHVNFELEQEELITISLNNARGTQLRKLTTLGTMGANNLSIDTANLPEQLIFYKISIGKATFVGKIVKSY